MSSDWDVYVENVRSWFVRKIISPLANQITQVDAQLENAGLGHLSCRFPATYSLAAKSLDSQGANSGSSSNSNSSNTGSNVRSHLYLSAPTNQSSKIQSLMDLVGNRPGDPLVKARLKLERYLSLASLTQQRVALMKRIAALAEGASLNVGGANEHFDDSQVIDRIDKSSLILFLSNSLILSFYSRFYYIYSALLWMKIYPLKPLMIINPFLPLSLSPLMNLLVCAEMPFKFNKFHLEPVLVYN